MPPPVRPEDMSDNEWYEEAGTYDHLDEIREEEIDNERGDE